MILIVWYFFLQGYFVLLLKSIEAHLRAWNINFLTAPVDPEMAPIWSEKLGFTILSDEEVTTFILLHIPLVHGMMKLFCYFFEPNWFTEWWNCSVIFWTKLTEPYNVFLHFANTNSSIPSIIVVLLPEELNAGVAPLGDVWEPNLGSKITCLSKSICACLYTTLKDIWGETFVDDLPVAQFSVA